MTRKLSVAMLSALLWAVSAPVAMAAAPAGPAGCKTHDPTKLGECSKSIIQPNAKGFWFVALLIGVVFVAFSRKRGQAVGIALGLLISGMVIYNPGGVGTMIHNVANQVF